jgi:glycosyltransferase involved in cell wall biosynthesis
MRVLTFGWDYPPKRNGGLGVACYGLTRELLGQGIEVIYVLPRQQPTVGAGKFVFADMAPLVKVRAIHSPLQPYHSAQAPLYITDATGQRIPTNRTTIEEVYSFAERAASIAAEEQFDIIHAHDWTSYLAGVIAKRVSGKPLVLHVHATSFDQAASNYVDPEIYKIEKLAFSEADCVLTVSDFTRRTIVEKHGVAKEKVEVVHNGADTFEPPRHEPSLAALKAVGKRVVLYHGRITIQKGVDYFVRAAKLVVAVEPNVVFVISGWGDMQEQIIEQVSREGLSAHVIFAGALWDDERDRMYQTADLVVMPSVSEPFGLVPLEALQHGTPSLISKQSGVAEVLTQVLKVDFWDVEDMANQIVAALRYPVLRRQLVSEGKRQLPNLSWRDAAHKVRQHYQRLVQLVAP